MGRPNNKRWNTEQASHFTGIPERTLSDLFARGILPAIPVGNSHQQKLRGGLKRYRRVNKWIVPREAFIAAWKTFRPVKVRRPRTAG